MAGFPHPASSAARRGVGGVRQVRDTPLSSGLLREELERFLSRRGAHSAWLNWAPCSPGCSAGSVGCLAACWRGSASSWGHRENAEAEPPSPSPVLSAGVPACAASSPGISLECRCCPRGCLLSSLCFGLTCSASAASSAGIGGSQGRACRCFPARHGGARLGLRPAAGSVPSHCAPESVPLTGAVMSTEQASKPGPRLRVPNRRF